MNLTASGNSFSTIATKKLTFGNTITESVAAAVSIDGGGTVE